MVEPGKHAPKRRVYLPEEVAQHSTPSDCYVSFLGRVVDVTPVVKENAGPLSLPLLQHAGEDISHWFTPSGELRTRVDPRSEQTVMYTPQGEFVHSHSAGTNTPWWKDSSLVIGARTACSRKVRIKNVLTEQEDVIEVPSEETVNEIEQRVLELNWHARSYTWKVLQRTSQGYREFVDLDKSRTLTDNGYASNLSSLFWFLCLSLVQCCCRNKPRRILCKRLIVLINLVAPFFLSGASYHAEFQTNHHCMKRWGYQRISTSQ